jgi:hypothetical protein
MFAPGMGVADAEGVGGSGTTGGGPDQGLDADGGGGVGGGEDRGGGAIRSRADVALGALLPIGGGGMKRGAEPAAGGGGSGSACIAPKTRVNSPGAGGGGAAAGGATGGAGAGAGGGFGGAAAAGFGGAGGGGALGPLPGSLKRIEIFGCGFGSGGFGSGAFGAAPGVHATVGESASPMGVPRGVPERNTSVNPPDGGAGATLSSHRVSVSKSRIMRVTTTGAPSTVSTPRTRSRESGGRRSRRESTAARSVALS